MKPDPLNRSDPRPDGSIGVRRMLLAAVAGSAVAIAATCLPLPLAVPLAALTILVASAVAIGSRLIVINHG